MTPTMRSIFSTEGRPMRVMTLAWFTIVGAAAIGGVQACSSDPGVQSSTGSTGAGGHGGGGTTAAETASVSATSTVASTASASSSVAASSSTGGAGLMCGTSSCDDTDLLGFVTLSACCPDNAPPDKCGLDLSTVSAFIGVSLGCVELNQPGAPDAGCPDQTISAMGQMVNLPGCCRPDMVCGNVVDFSAIAPGTNFGCIDGSTFLDAGAPPACGGGTGSSTSSTGATSSSATSGSTGSGAGGAGP